MSDEMKEKISAYLDGELEIEHLSRLDQQLLTSPELRNKLNRYALISESIKGNHTHCHAAGVVDFVHEALQQEPTVFAPGRAVKKAPAPWKTYVGGAAIAATVAALAVFNISLFNQPHSPVEEFPVTVDALNANPASLPYFGELSQRASTKWTTRNSASPEIEDELNQFLIDHSEYTTQTGTPGLLPYATFVVYDKPSND